MNLFPKLKIHQKGLIMVSVTLILELIFIITLSALLKEAENAAALANYSKQMIAGSEALLKDFYDMGAALITYGVTRDSGRRKNVLDAIGRAANDLDQLKTMSTRNADDEQSLQKIGSAGHKVLEIFVAAAREFELDRRSQSWLKAEEYRNRAKDGMNQLVAELHALVERHKQIEKRLPDAEAHARQQVKLSLLLGLILNIALAVFLALFFSKGITSRLAVLRDKSVRYEQGQELGPPIRGDDELSELDRSFHHMAAVIAEARRKETAVIDNAVDVLCSLDEQGKFIRINPAAGRTWGYAADELVGRQLADLIAPEDVQNTLLGIDEAKNRGTSRTFESRVIKKDGSSVHMLWSVYWSGLENAFFCVSHDITDRKEIEKMKQDFVAMVSHDLRSPLTAVSVCLEGFLQGMYGPISDQGVNRLFAAESSVKRLIKLINDLLDVQKLEAGQMVLSRQTITVQSLFQECFLGMRDLADANEITFILQKTALTVWADRERLVQVLVNLISNALKFSPAGGEITLSAVDVGDYVEMRVTDQGPGIPDSEKQRIFERFKQIEGSATYKKGGTGLGLAICKSIIEAHGGCLGVESELGKGSTFWFRIPVVRESSEPDAAPVSAGEEQPV